MPVYQSVYLMCQLTHLAPIEEGTCIFVFLHILHDIENFISFSMFCCFLCLLNTKQANFKLFEFVFKRKVTTTGYFARLSV